MHIRTRLAASALAALAVAGGAAGAAAAQATPHAPGQLTFVSQLTAIRFFTASGPITGFPTRPLVPGDRRAAASARSQLPARARRWGLRSCPLLAAPRPR